MALQNWGEEDEQPHFSEPFLTLSSQPVTEIVQVSGRRQHGDAERVCKHMPAQTFDPVGLSDFTCHFSH